MATNLYGPRGPDYYIHRASYSFLYVLDIRGHPNFAAAVLATANLFRYAELVVLRICREATRCLDPAIGIFSESVVAREGKDGEVLFGELGHSVERWVWWKERWGQLAADDGLGEDGRANAREALEDMRRVALEDRSNEE
jgi:hypothetical protein